MISRLICWMRWSALCSWSPGTWRLTSSSVWQGSGSSPENTTIRHCRHGVLLPLIGNGLLCHHISRHTLLTRLTVGSPNALPTRQMKLGPFQRNTDDLALARRAGRRVRAHPAVAAARRALGVRRAGVRLCRGGRGRVPCARPTCARCMRPRRSIIATSKLLRAKLAGAAHKELAKPQPKANSQLEYRQQLLQSRRRKEALRAKGTQEAGMAATAFGQALPESRKSTSRPSRPTSRPAGRWPWNWGSARRPLPSGIASCREVGLLGPAERGKASVGPRISVLPTASPAWSPSRRPWLHALTLVVGKETPGWT